MTTFLWILGFIVLVLLICIGFYVSMLLDLRKQEKGARFARQFKARLDQVIEGGK